MYLKEREAFFAIRDVCNDTKLMKRYLEHYKRRVHKVDTHLERVGIYEKTAAAQTD